MTRENTNRTVWVRHYYFELIATHIQNVIHTRAKFVFLIVIKNVALELVLLVFMILETYLRFGQNLCKTQVLNYKNFESTYKNSQMEFFVKLILPICIFYSSESLYSTKAWKVFLISFSPICLNFSHTLLGPVNLPTNI